MSDAIAYEYADVLSRKLSRERWEKLQPVLGTLLALANFTTIYYSWRPSSPITYLRDFQKAKETLNLQVMTPQELVILLAG
ncbi:hypothetical protein [Oscillatoria salina]|uniref:hypothetical protein n=1 Tax=Oscillatoria salina TaxID=331517 RepID=UPI001CCB4CC3|nr:hypothetical protein [Oscillatoria salina]